VERLGAAADRLEATDALLRGVPGVRALVGDAALTARLADLLDDLGRDLDAVEARLDATMAGGADLEVAGDLEAVNAGLIRVKDAWWALRRDRLGTADAVADLAGPRAGIPALAAHLSVQQALSALDRLEVRGRDSAGLHLLVRGHGLDRDEPGVADELARRGGDPLFGGGSVRWVDDGTLSFVYKAAAEIGELGDNTRVLRDAIRGDRLLRRALAAEGASAVVLGHTRWASIGIVSEPNAHPLNAEELGDDPGPYVTAVLNGDVDNFADLKATEGLRIPAEITTDAKVIPTLTARRLADGEDAVEAFRTTVNRLEGSVAIAASVAQAPDDLFLALRGSGQALYVGLADDAYVVASEPYGVVEETARYVRMDGDTAADPGDPATRGQVVRLHGARAGSLEGVERWAYNGQPLPVGEGDVDTAQITTRDIDRGDHPHFLLKEISEAPASFRKTLRGKLVERDGRLEVVLGEDVVPAPLARALGDGTIRRVLAIGQGTAAVASRAFVATLAEAVPRGRLVIEAVLATELSGFSLDGDMSDTLVVAVSQSGTTTDTNRTVDLVRARGAAVVSIVNRRGSDLTDRSDGVLYTSDGRDVEMSVASTKAFYSQIAAGVLLAVAVADLVDTGLADRDGPATGRAALLEALRDLPSLMERTLELRPTIAEAAQRFAPSRRYWAIVGNGANQIAAAEIRIKLSELCYKSIACDGTEDKKHIDLSSEPLILVCAAGLQGSTADDVAKEVAIYRAHKATPVVIASEGEERFGAAVHAVFVPATHPSLAFVLSTMVGHLFGYEAALAIDAQAHPLREARAAIEAAVAEGRGLAGDGDALLADLQAPLAAAARRFGDGLRSGELDGHLEASTAVRLASLFRYATSVLPLDSFQVEHGRVGTPSVVVEELTSSLTSAIEELTRPVDAIKHQAKTVTVGISRSDETLLQVRLVQEVLAAGVARDRLSYASLRDLGALEPLVDEVLGWTRYRVEGRVDGDDEAGLHVIDRGGLGRELRSRTDSQPVLRGTKRRVAAERVVLLARGAADGRTVLIVPEVKDNQTTGLTLLHITLRDGLGQVVLRSVLQGYRARYTALRDAVLETEPSFRDDLLTTVEVTELLTAPIHDVAEHWRT
jgi:glucosamine--fructose-6-phosphate aminotransferase (isomerizing)